MDFSFICAVRTFSALLSNPFLAIPATLLTAFQPEHVLGSFPMAIFTPLHTALNLLLDSSAL